MRKPLSVIAAAAALGFAYGTIMGPGETNADNELMRDPVFERRVHPWSSRRAPQLPGELPEGAGAAAVINT